MNETFLRPFFLTPFKGDHYFFLKMEYVVHFLIEKCIMNLILKKSVTCPIFKRGVMVTLFKGGEQKYSQFFLSLWKKRRTAVKGGKKIDKRFHWKKKLKNPRERICS